MRTVDTRNAGTAFKHATVSFVKLASLVRCSSDISKNKLLGLPLASDASEVGNQTTGFAAAETARSFTWQSAIAWPSKHMSDLQEDLEVLRVLDSLQSFFVVLLTLRYRL